jgi:hypothetical protein
MDLRGEWQIAANDGAAACLANGNAIALQSNLRYRKENRGFNRILLFEKPRGKH